MSNTVGAALRAAREERRLTLAQVSESTKVRIHYLQALENDDISAMPSAAQARGFLRLYVDFLGLDLGSLIPNPAAVVTEPQAETEAAPKAASGAKAKPRLSQLFTGLKARIASRLPDRSMADAQASIEAGDAGSVPPSVPSEIAEPQVPPDDKKKQNR